MAMVKRKRQRPHDSQREQACPDDLAYRSLSVRASTIDEKTRSVQAVIATDTPTEVFDFRSFEIIQEALVISGARFADQVVLLESHSRFSLDSVLGSVRDIKREDNNVVGRLVFAEGDERAERAWNKVRQGHVTDVSVGYRVEDSVDIKPNSTQLINGKRYTAGARTLRVTTAWTIRETSLIPIGADQKAKIRARMDAQRIDANGGDRQTRSLNMSAKQRSFLEEIGLRADASDEQEAEFLDGLDDEQREEFDALKVKRRAKKKSEAVRDTPDEPDPVPAPANNDPADVASRAVAEERTRVAALQEMAGDDIAPELLRKAISEGWEQSRASASFLRALRESRADPVGDAPVIHTAKLNSNQEARAMGAALMERAGLDDVGDGASDAVREQFAQDADRGARFRGYSLAELCRESLRLAGRQEPHAREEMIRAAASTSQLQFIFTSVVNAQLLKSYAEALDTTDGWIREVDVPDFKSNERTRLGKTGSLAKLARGGEAEHASISDVKETYAVARYARQFVVDDMDIIDDRFNALLDMPREMGAAARRLRPDLVYSILLANANLSDGVALFHATHNNLLASNPLAAPALEAGITAMGKQTEDGVNLNVRPRFLLVPMDLKHTAAILLKSAQRIISSASGGTLNPLLEEDIAIRSDNRIGVAGVTDPATGTSYTGTAVNWFLTAAPNAAPTIEVGYLRGSGRAPQLRSFVRTEGKWGLAWDIKMDIGAKALDSRGLFKAVGS